MFIDITECTNEHRNEHSEERLFIVSILSPHLTMLCLYPLVCDARNFVAKSLIK